MLFVSYILILKKNDEDDVADNGYKTHLCFLGTDLITI